MHSIKLGSWLPSKITISWVTKKYSLKARIYGNHRLLSVVSSWNSLTMAISIKKLLITRNPKPYLRKIRFGMYSSKFCWV